MKTKLISVFIAIVTVFAVSFSAYAAGSLTMNNVNAKSGDVFTVEVNLSGNPGIIATRIIIDYDNKYLALEKAENGEIFASSKALFGKDYSEAPYKMLWDDALGSNITANGKLAILTFRVKEESPSGKTSVKVTVDASSTFDEDLKEKSITGAECIVSFPTVTKAEKETVKESTTQKTEVSSAKPAENGTTKSLNVTTTKQNPSITSPTTPTATKIQEEILGTKDSAFEKTTVKKHIKTENATDSQEVLNPEQEMVIPETNSNSITETERVSVTEQQTETKVFVQDEETVYKKQYLWFLLIIPIAAAILVLIKFKKAGGKNVQ